MSAIDTAGAPLTESDGSGFGPADEAAGSFTEDVEAALQQVRAAFEAVLERLPGPILRATDLQRVLGIDYKLALQVFNVTKSADLVSAASQVPGSLSLKRFLIAADSAGVTRGSVSAVRLAVERFDAMVRRHASDRVKFDAMIAAACGDDSTE